MFGFSPLLVNGLRKYIVRVSSPFINSYFLPPIGKSNMDIGKPAIDSGKYGIESNNVTLTKSGHDARKLNIDYLFFNTFKL